MSSMSVVQDFLAQKRIAMVGVSRDPKDFSRSLFHDLCLQGYDVVAVNPYAKDIDGRPCAASLREVQPPPDGVLVMTSADATDSIVETCGELGVKRVWLYRAAGAGAVSESAVRFCQEHGVSVVAGECPYMFLPGAPWFHKVHGFISKITGTYPK